MPFNINNKTVFGGYLPLVAKHLNRASALGAIVEDPDKLDRSVYQLQTAYNTSTLENAMAALIDPSLTGYVPGVNNGAARLLSLFPQSDVLQSTAANQPLLLRWNSGEGNYLYLPGNDTTLNTLSSSNNNNLDGDLDIIIEVNKPVYTQPQFRNFGTKRDINNGISFGQLSIAGLVYLELRTTNSGITTNYQTTVGLDPVLFENKKVFFRYFYNQTNNQILFYYGYEINNFILIDSLPITSTIGNNNSINYLIGNTLEIQKQYSNKIYRGNYLNNILLYSFIANDYNINLSQNTILSNETGEIWTINYAVSSTSNKIQLVYKTSIQFDGINDSLRTSVDTLLGLVTSEYLAFSLFNLTAGQRIKDGTIANTGEVIKAATGYNITQGSAPLATQLSFRIVCNIHKYDDQLNQAYIKVNGVTQFFGTTNQNVRLLTLGASGAITAFSNFMFNSYIASKQYDGLVREQIINNLIKQLNGFTI